MTTTRIIQLSSEQRAIHLRQAVEAVADPSGWRHHGLGLVQKYVSESVRVHVWHESLDRGVRSEGGAIHDHRFDLVSDVIAGAILNDELEVYKSPGGSWSSWTVINASDERGPEPPELLESGLDVWESHRLTVKAGQAYRLPARVFHCSTPVPSLTRDRCVVTVVTRYNLQPSRARILSVGQPSHAFAEGHLPSPELVAEVLKIASATLAKRV